MNTNEDLEASISDLRKARRHYRVLPHGIVASLLLVSHQRLSDLILHGVVRTEVFLGWKCVDVSSALKYAKSRYHRKCIKMRLPKFLKGKLQNTNL